MKREITIPVRSYIDTGVELPEAELRAIVEYDTETGQLSGVCADDAILCHGPSQVFVSVSTVVALVNGLSFSDGSHILTEGLKRQLEYYVEQAIEVEAAALARAAS
jgi:hypothetical protein